MSCNKHDLESQKEEERLERMRSARRHGVYSNRLGILLHELIFQKPLTPDEAFKKDEPIQPSI